MPSVGRFTPKAEQNLFILGSKMNWRYENLHFIFLRIAIAGTEKNAA